VLPRVLMWAGLLTVAGAAAIMSFAALRDLAALCGFGSALAPLLPVTVDAGAAVASLVWLGRWAPDPARRYARGLALALLGGSVAGNALGHGLAAYGARPHWLVVVAVSAVAPAVLGAVVHLAVLATHTPATGVADHPDHNPDYARSVADHPDHPDREFGQAAPAAVDQLTELNGPCLISVGGSGEGGQVRPMGTDHPDHPDYLGAAGTDHPDPTGLTASEQPERKDAELIELIREWVADEGSAPSRERVRTRYGIGSKRAERVRTLALTPSGGLTSETTTNGHGPVPLTTSRTTDGKEA